MKTKTVEVDYSFAERMGYSLGEGMIGRSNLKFGDKCTVYFKYPTRLICRNGWGDIVEHHIENGLYADVRIVKMSWSGGLAFSLYDYETHQGKYGDYEGSISIDVDAQHKLENETIIWAWNDEEWERSTSIFFKHDMTWRDVGCGGNLKAWRKEYGFDSSKKLHAYSGMINETNNRSYEDKDSGCSTLFNFLIGLAVLAVIILQYF